MDYKTKAESRIKKENVRMNGQKENAMRDAVAKALAEKGGDAYGK